MTPGLGPPDLDSAAAEALAAGQAQVAAGDVAAALETYRAGVALDGRLFCHPWGLIPWLEDQGRGSIRTRMMARRDAWYHGDPAHRPVVAPLASKRRLRQWAEAAGVPVPRLIAEAPGLDALDWAALPGDGIVLKPLNATERKGVVALKDGIDHMAQAPVGPDLAGYVAGVWEAAGVAGQQVLVEELVDELDPPPGTVIARDIKCYCVAGRVGMVQMVDRNGQENPRRIATFDRTGARLPQSSTVFPYAWDIAPPAGWDAAIAAAEQLSAGMPWLVRFDFYGSTRGPLLGEITTFPNAGKNYSHFGRRTLLQMWEMVPDVGL